MTVSFFNSCVSALSSTKQAHDPEIRSSYPLHTLFVWWFGIFLIFLICCVWCVHFDVFSSLPEWKDDQPCHHEHCGKNHKNGVADVLPLGVVE